MVGLFFWKNNLLRCWGWPTLLDWGPCFISFEKTASKKIGALTRSNEVSFSRGCSVSLWIYHIHVMECCCHVWAGAPNCYFELLAKLQRRTCRSVGPSIVASPEPLAHRKNVANLSLLYHLKSFSNRRLLYCRFFLKRFCVCFNLFVVLFLVTPCLVVAFQHCMK